MKQIGRVEEGRLSCWSSEDKRDLAALEHANRQPRQGSGGRLGACHRPCLTRCVGARQSYDMIGGYAWWRTGKA